MLELIGFFDSLIFFRRDIQDDQDKKYKEIAAFNNPVNLVNPVKKSSDVNHV